MSQRRETEQRLALYTELTEIMSAMKNMAQVELHRVGRLVKQQAECRNRLDEALATYVKTHQWPEPTNRQQQIVFVIVASERGFCANYNDVLQPFVDDVLNRPAKASVIVVGNRLGLSAKQTSGSADVQVINGATTALEIPQVLDELMQRLDKLADLSAANLTLMVIHHSNEGVSTQQVFPWQASVENATVLARPARLNLPPDRLFHSLQRHWLYHALLSILYEALHIENHMRLSQMEGAIHHLNESSDSLKISINRLRQEAIVEEIEVIFSKQGDGFGMADNAP